MDNIVRYYDGYNEDIRLIKDRAYQIEFITTIKYLDEFIHSGMKVLDLGAGKCRYSIHMAKKAVHVTAVDIVPKHVEEIRNKANNANVELKAVVGNGKDLREFKDNSFDAVILKHISTDGMMSTLATKINVFEDEEFEKWMEYHLLICEESSLVGCGLHGLYIGKV